MTKRFLQCRTQLPMLFHNGSHVVGGLGFFFFFSNPGLDEFKKLSRVSSPRVTLEFDSSHYQSNLFFFFVSPPLLAISLSFQFKRTRCLGIRSV